MSNVIKKIFKLILARLGYVVYKRSTRLVSFTNFESLAIGYEVLDNAYQEGNREQFSRRVELLSRLQGTRPFQAYHLIRALDRVKNLPGDVCEFGVAQGETSALIANEIRNQNKRLHLFDSFAGLPMPTEKDRLLDDIYGLGRMDAYFQTMAFPEKLVTQRLVDIGFPKNKLLIHKGFVEEVIELDGIVPELVSFAYVDFDFYEPIRVVLQYLHRVTKKGSIIIVDDYGFFSEGAQLAVDEFLKEMNRDAHMYELDVPSTEIGHFAVVSRLI